MEIKELEARKNTLNSYIGEDLSTYGGSTYICDAISELADNSVDIYYSDLKEWGKDHFDEIESAIDEFGWDGVGKDLYKAIQMAQFMELEREAYDEIDEIIENYAISVIINNYKDYDYIITEELVEEILDGLNFDSNDRFSDIDDYVIGVLEEHLDPSNEDDLEA